MKYFLFTLFILLLVLRGRISVKRKNFFVKHFLLCDSCLPLASAFLKLRTEKIAMLCFELKLVFNRIFASLVYFTYVFTFTDGGMHLRAIVIGGRLLE